MKHLPEVVVAVDAGGRLQGLERLEPLQCLLHLELQGADVAGELGDLLQRPPGSLPQRGGELGRCRRPARAQGGGQVVVHLRGRASQILGQVQGPGPHRTVDVVSGGQRAEQLEAVISAGYEAAGDGRVGGLLQGGLAAAAHARPGHGGPGHRRWHPVPAAAGQGHRQLHVGIAPVLQDPQELDDEVTGGGVLLPKSLGGVGRGRQDDGGVGLLPGGHPQPRRPLGDGQGSGLAQDGARLQGAQGPGPPEGRVVGAVDERHLRGRPVGGGGQQQAVVAGGLTGGGEGVECLGGLQDHRHVQQHHAVAVTGLGLVAPQGRDDQVTHTLLRLPGGDHA